MSNYPIEWRYGFLKDIAKVISGYAFSSSDFQNSQKQGMPVIRMSDIQNNELNLREAKRVSNYSQSIVEKVQIQQGDLLFGMSGSIEKSVLVGRSVKALLNQRVGALRPIQKNNNFHAFIFQSDVVRNQIKDLAAGGAQLNISSSQVESIKIPIPPLPEQQKIAEILSKIDLSIKHQEEKLKRLKEIPQSMFSDLLSKTKLRYLQLHEIANLERGKFSHRPRNDPNFFNGEYPYLQITQIPKDRLFVRTHKETLNKNGLSVSRLFKKGTLVISIIAQIGEVGILNYDACFPDNLVAIKPKKLSGSNSEYLLFVLRGMRDKIQNLAPQTAQKSINLEILKILEIPFPDLTYQLQISEFLRRHEICIEKLEVKIQKTRLLKYAISQDLLSGNKRVNF